MSINDLLQRDDAEYATEAELAKAFGKSISALRTWGVRRIGPPRTHVGRSVLYRIGGLRKWLKAQEAA